jgi:hypothetical protein
MKCPDCNVELIIDSITPEQVDECYYEDFVGTCPYCGTSWEWSDVYEFKTSSQPVKSETLKEILDHI